MTCHATKCEVSNAVKHIAGILSQISNAILKTASLLKSNCLFYKTVVLLLLPLFVGVLCLVLVCYAVLSVLFSSLAIILMGKRELVVLLCLPDVCVLWLFLTVPWGGLHWCVIVVFPNHTHSLGQFNFSLNHLRKLNALKLMN